MKNLKKLSLFALPVVLSTILTSCAAGAATAGYAIKAQSADGLTAEAEQRIINRAKAEMMCDMPMRCSAPTQCTPYPQQF